MAFSSPLRQSEVTPRRRRRTSTLLNRSLSPGELLESPSRHLVVEFQKLWNDQNKHLQDDLDEQLAQQAERHEQALAIAAAEHDRIRKNAEIERERVELELEKDRQLRDAREKDRLETERQAKVAREAEERRKENEILERQRREQAAKAEEEREISANKARLEEEQRRKEVEDAARRQQQEEEAAKAKERAREAVANAAKAREEAQKSTQAPQATAQAAAPSQATKVEVTPPAPTQAAASNVQQGQDPLQNEFEDLHKRYLELHKQLKQLRQYVTTECKKIPSLKTRLGELRREITQCTGQLTRDKSKNRSMMSKILVALQESTKHNTPSVDVSPYLVSVAHPAPGQQIPMSGPFLYLLNIFAKAVLSQFVDETAGSVGAADPVGVVAVTVFATPSLKLNQTIPLIDILLAKYHAACPLLFCITNGTNTNTAAGRARIGWKSDNLQRHLERMTGLSAGWAALSLRDFSKSKNVNPLPNYHYWRAIAGIANTPSRDVGESHVEVIKALIDSFVPRFIGFYGVPARAALKAALVDLPARVRRDRPNDASASKATAGLDLLREQLQRTQHLTLT